MKNFQKKIRLRGRSSTKNAAKTTFKDKLTIALLMVSLAATLLAFIGYGVAAAANLAFNIPHEVLFQSPFELVELSVWFITQVTSWAASVTFSSLYAHLFYRALLSGAILFVAWVVVYVLVRLPKMRNKYAEKVNSWRKSLLAIPDENMPFKIVLLQAITGGAAFILTVPLVAAFVIYLIIASIILMPAVSLIGATAAEKHIQEYVIGPARCQPLMSREYRLSQESNKDEKFATCLSATMAKKEYRGREVLTTSSATLLFDPTSGKVVRIPTSRATIETVDSL